MAGLEFLLLLLGSTALLTYALYVWFLVLRADFYSVTQKALQAVLVVCLPVAGALLVHYVYRAHVKRQRATDNAFVPQAPIMDPISQASSLKDET